MWKQQFAAAALALVAACAPAREGAVHPEAPVMAEPAKLMTWDDLSALPRPVASHTIRWGEGVTDEVDLWLPEGAGPHPVVVMVHGGCWQKSIADKNLMDWMADGLRQQGWAVWNIEYRGVDEPGGGYPGTFLDAGAATDQLRQHAAEFNLDLSRVTGIGHSAGGHLILWLAARSKLPEQSPLRVSDPLQFQGVVVSGGLADLEASRPVTAPSCLDAVYDQLTGPASPERPDPLADTSPARLFPAGVPFVSVNGSEDRIAPPMLGDALTRKAEAAGDSASLVVVPASGHVELVSPGTQAFDIQSQILSDFIASPGARE
ncbi:alpha/beta hydrolase [Hyphomonas sp.]|uniref:alpha/beta hydrolase n=1 Tax=Hyphomonas sp. TaxID=87 RepID=UPI000A898EC8|nr:alpha/beta hydrolase [Hyphomonas sp.]